MAPCKNEEGRHKVPPLDSVRREVEGDISDDVTDNVNEVVHNRTHVEATEDETESFVTLDELDSDSSEGDTARNT